MIFKFSFYRQLTIDQTTNKQAIKTILEDEKVHLEEKLKSLGVAENKPETSVKKPSHSPEPDAIEIQKRQEYLRQQRDKLIALKKEARKKQLDTETTVKPQARPKSAKAAEKILKGDLAANIDPQQLQIRRSLAERLRDKVVNKE